jgi:hypothetical protein
MEPNPVVPAANPAANSLLLKFKQAVPILGLTEWQIRGLVASGDLKCVRIGKRLYLRRKTVERFVENAEGEHRALNHRPRKKSGKARKAVETGTYSPKAGSKTAGGGLVAADTVSAQNSPEAGAQ